VTTNSNVTYVLKTELTLHFVTAQITSITPPTPVKNAHTNVLTVLDSNPIVTHVPLTESTNQIVDAQLDSSTSKTKQNVEDVLHNVLPVPELLIIVSLVPKTDLVQTNVTVQPLI
jgi:hypothetical protein